MSGTSWFDLSSIQDQINKSIQEAAKLAEDASKYDILNFDAMAEQEAEEEERDYDSGDDQDTVGNGDIQATAPILLRDHYGTTPKTVNITTRSPLHSGYHDSKANAKMDVDSSHFHSEKAPSASVCQGAPRTLTGDGIDQQKQLSLFSTPSHAGSDIHRHDSDENDNFRSTSSSSYKTITLTADSCPTSSGMTNSAGDSEDRSSERDIEYDRNCDNHNPSLTSINTASVPIPHNEHGLISTPTKIIPALADVTDDFFGDQFNTIHTIKKDKPPRTSSYTCDAEGSSSAMNKSNTIKGLKTELLGQDIILKESLPPSLQDNEASILPSHSLSSVVAAVSGKERRKRKKERKKGSLDFFGMSSAAISVPAVVPTTGGESSDLNSFTFFEPIGTLNDDVEEGKFDDSVYSQHTSSSFSAVDRDSTSSSGGTRLPQRLPGLRFNSHSNNGDSEGVMSLSYTSTAAGKVLFSFFDNVEDEIDSNEDPILRQVAFNKANPDARSESSYSKVLNIFGISSDSQIKVADGDIESNRLDPSGHIATGAIELGAAYANSNSSSNSSSSIISKALLSLHFLLDTVVVFARGLMSCLGTVYIEATNGVGAPITHWNNVSSHIGRSGSVPGGGATSNGANMEVDKDMLKLILPLSLPFEFLRHFCSFLIRFRTICLPL